jgi:hypothetical protein
MGQRAPLSQVALPRRGRGAGPPTHTSFPDSPAIPLLPRGVSATTRTGRIARFPQRAFPFQAAIVSRSRGVTRRADCTPRGPWVASG